MKRRTFLKGMTVAMAVAIAPPLAANATTNCIRGRGWKLVAKDRVVRDCTDLFVFKRRAGDEIHTAHLSTMWWDKTTDARALEMIREIYP